MHLSFCSGHHEKGHEQLLITKDAVAVRNTGYRSRLHLLYNTTEQIIGSRLGSSQTSLIGSINEKLMKLAAESLHLKES